MWNQIQPRDNTTRFDPHDASTTGFQVYNVPKGAVELDILCVGRGGNGGNGFGAAAGTARGGGGGGGSGAITRLRVAASLLPSVLYVQSAPRGGSQESAVKVTPTTGVGANTICFASNGQNGGNGTAAAAGAAGTAGAIATAANTVYGSLGQWVAIAGQGGAAGGVHTGAVGASVTFGNAGVFVSAGAGGAGCTTTEFAGGNITGAGLIQTISGGALGANPGSPGRSILRPLTYTGGSGAGSSNTVAGAVGGDGAPGSGGGGGGAGVTTGGVGGLGGPGFVIITAIFG